MAALLALFVEMFVEKCALDGLPMGIPSPLQRLSSGEMAELQQRKKVVEISSLEGFGFVPDLKSI